MIKAVRTQQKGLFASKARPASDPWRWDQTLQSHLHSIGPDLLQEIQSRAAIPAEAVWVGILNLEENPESHDNPHICRAKEWCFPTIWGVAAGQTAVPCLRYSLSQCSSQRDPSKPLEHIIPHHIAFHELQIAQRTCENPHMTNEDDTVLPSLLFWLSSWSSGHPLLSACWSPYPRPVPTFGPCHRLFPLLGTLFLQVSLWWPPSLLGVSARIPPSWWALPDHAFNYSEVSHHL